MCVKRSVAKTAAASVEETTAPSSTRLEPGEVEEHVRGDARQDGADDDADRAQERRGHRDLAQAAPRRLQAALVEDQREPDDADLAGELRVVELDPARPVGAEQHPEREERRRARAAPFARHRARRRCCRPGSPPTSRSRRPSSTLLSSPGGSPARAAWNTSGMATRPRTRKIGRLSEIAQVAVRHGFGYFFERHKLTDLLPWTTRVEPSPEPPPAPSAAGTCGRCSTSSARRSSSSASCSRPGPTSCRRTSSPSCAASRTTSRPFPFAQVREVVEAELGLTLEQAFVEFDETPIAAASIGQVHRAVAPERRRGRRQGAAPERAESDRERPRAALPGRAPDQGARARARLHRRQRARRRVRALHPPGARLQARGAERRHVPAQLRATRTSSSCRRSTGTTPASRMLTLEYLEGVQLADLELEATAVDARRELAYRVTDTWMEMIFRHGFFHADPHPANVLVLDGGRIGLVDFGLVGQAHRRGHGAADAALHRRRDRERRRAAAPARRARRPLPEGARGGVRGRAARALLPLLRREPRRHRPDPGDPRGLRADLLDEPAAADAVRAARQGDRDARRASASSSTRRSTSSRSRGRTRAS